MNNLDKQYQALLSDILKNGARKNDRTGTGTLSVFGRQIRHKMSEGFPLITTKKVYWKGVVEELLWFLRGETNIAPLVKKSVNIWVGDCYQRYLREYQKLKNEGGPCTEQEFIEKIKSDEQFADKWGELGPVYGAMWRRWPKKMVGKMSTKPPMEYWGEVDQIAEAIHLLRTSPDSRRILVNAWNPAEIENAVLPPCHYSFQFYTHVLLLEERIKWAKENHPNFDVLDEFGINSHEALEESTERVHTHLSNVWQVPDRGLSLMWNQRSCDVALGIPFNCASYSLLLCIIAKHVNMIPHELIGNLGDAHIYLNQIDGVNKQLAREPFPLPTLRISEKKVSDISEHTFDDLALENYKSHSAIKMPLSN